MKQKEIMENQYKKGKIVTERSFDRLRDLVGDYEVTRSDVAFDMLEPGETFLELGCGDGGFMFRAEGLYDSLYGIDISPHRIELARMKCSAPTTSNKLKHHFLEFDINDKLTHPDSFFDVVVSVAVLQYSFDPYSVLSEINRVMKQDGILILQVPNIAYIKHRISLLFGNLPITSTPFNWSAIGWEGGSLHNFTRPAFINLLESSGFSVTRSTGSGLFPGVRNVMPNLLFGDVIVKAIKTG